MYLNYRSATCITFNLNNSFESCCVPWMLFSIWYKLPFFTAIFSPISFSSLPLSRFIVIFFLFRCGACVHYKSYRFEFNFSAYSFFFSVSIIINEKPPLFCILICTFENCQCSFLQLYLKNFVVQSISMEMNSI